MSTNMTGLGWFSKIFEFFSSDINATYFRVSDFTLTVAFSVNPYKLR